jgi:lambda repressor-like predicted transcriptional regulator
MTPSQRLKISAARGGGTIAAAARARGHSLRSLARQIGCSQALLSQIDAGTTRLSEAVAAKLRAAIGWPPE